MTSQSDAASPLAAADPAPLGNNLWIVASSVSPGIAILRVAPVTAHRAGPMDAEEADEWRRRITARQAFLGAGVAPAD